MELRANLTHGGNCIRLDNEACTMKSTIQQQTARARIPGPEVGFSNKLSMVT